ncbi:MAG TPA: HDOD domain-containing protein [Anaeromyxobacteraceae bacterium]|nr:HDOD domain-containing protein [Anaeromyxobacteraceae bacterium]
MPAEPPPLPDEERVADEQVAALVRERFAAARPEPSSFPAIALQILNHAADPGADVQELARLVARDPALSAGVLSVANSPVYRGLMEVETVRDAVARLGLDELGKVAAAVSARTLFSPRQRAEHQAFAPRFSALFGHAVAVGSAAAAAALRRPDARADRAYLGGLLHDVGKSLALRALAGLVLDRRVVAPPPERVERVLDAVHVELGGEAHQIWGLPHYLTVLCVRHHDPAVPGEPEFVDLHLVRLASALADLREPLWAARAAREVAQSAAALGVDPFAVRALAAELRQAEARADRAFSPAAPATR